MGEVESGLCNQHVTKRSGLDFNIIGLSLCTACMYHLGQTDLESHAALEPQVAGPVDSGCNWLSKNYFIHQHQGFSL